MKRAARRLWITAAALVAIAGGGFGGVQVWRLRHQPLRFLQGVRFVCEVDVDHPFMDGMSHDAIVGWTSYVVAQRLKRIAPLARVDAYGSRLEVQVPAWRTTVPLQVIAQLITRSGRLELKLVDDGSDIMQRWLVDEEAEPSEGVEIGHDSWTDKQSGQSHRDVFFQAADEAALQRLFAKLPVPDHEIAFEKVTDRDGHDAWRSYYLFRRAEISGEDIQASEVVIDPASNRPEISLQLDDRGEKRFEDVTARAVGRKLAILFEGRVRSAPLVEGKIAGGKARMTMQGNDAETQKQEAIDLLSILRAGNFAAPVRIIDRRDEGPAG